MLGGEGSHGPGLDQVKSYAVDFSVGIWVFWKGAPDFQES